MLGCLVLQGLGPCRSASRLYEQCSTLNQGMPTTDQWFVIRTRAHSITSTDSEDLRYEAALLHL